ncbi:MAG: hypothetical protein JOZ71_10105, partial [Ktedonobacteraceae bacterium]|nr:hypothetical protein [Ktedonobacteraceae bacterium]
FQTDTTVPSVNRPSAGMVTLPSSAEIMLLVTSSFNTAQHLYILDGTNHRILDLQMASVPSPGTPTASREASPSVTMKLVRQYASTQALGHVRSMAVDPSKPALDVLVQKDDAAGQQVITTVNINPNNQNSCT